MGWQKARRTRAGGAGSSLGVRARPAQSGPAHPRCPRGASAGAQRRALTSAAPGPPALLLRSRRQVVLGRCGSCAPQAVTTAAGARPLELREPCRPLGQRWVSPCWHGNGHVSSPGAGGLAQPTRRGPVGSANCASWHLPGATGLDGSGLALKLSEARGRSPRLQASGLQPNSVKAGRGGDWTPRQVSS